MNNSEILKLKHFLGRLVRKSKENKNSEFQILFLNMSKIFKIVSKNFEICRTTFKITSKKCEIKIFNNSQKYPKKGKQNIEEITRSPFL